MDSLNVQVREVRVVEVFDETGTKSSGLFLVTEEWNGLVKLARCIPAQERANDKSTLIIEDPSDSLGFFGRILRDPKAQRNCSVIKASPTLIMELKKP